ncbi:MAG: glycosyl hydrolase [Fimbriimonas sp.]
MAIFALPLLLLSVTPSDALARRFATPPPEARPWVYWYFMEGNMTREGLTADLEAMRKAGLGGGIFLEVNIGIPRGPVRYMSPEWLEMVGHSVKEADRLGLAIDFGTGPGWCGTGGPWVTPDHAMQHLVASEAEITGPRHFNAVLPRPTPRTPFFGLGTLTPELRRQWETYYRDEVVLALPTPPKAGGLSGLDEKSLVYRAPYSSQPGVPSHLYPETEAAGPDRVVPSAKVVDLTSRMKPDGTLDWTAPEGRWTILRFGRTLTGQTSRPAPDAGLGFETDKFETPGVTAHLERFVDAVLRAAGPKRRPGRGLTALHFDSWEMGSQNWSANFRAHFGKRRGYDPIRYLPVMAGRIVDSVDVSERFLWDLRQTAQELVIENHMGTVKRKARENGLELSVEPYDMNPASDLSLGGVADEPMCEFWSKGYGFNSEYSCFEAVSIAHTNGRKVVGAEAFTSDDRDAWLQHPASMKEQGDWALANGINKFYFHRYQHQPKLDEFPGMTMGPYGVHWERTQTWWDMVPAYHRYLARCQALLREGLPVADILYLAPEGAPNVFEAPASATIGELPDRRGYNFDACAPETLIARARAKDGRIVFPDGMSYRVLVLPRVETMTPRLLRKVVELAEAGATIVGNPPKRSPSLSGYPACDGEVRLLAQSLARRIVPDPFAESQAPSLSDAQWIWEAKGDPASSAAVGTRTFARRFTIRPGRKVASALVAFTADNSYALSVNGKPALKGSDFHRVGVFDAKALLQAGENRLEVRATNDGPRENPAGIIGALQIRFADGGELRLTTDATWQAEGEPAKALGAWNMAPWSLGSGAFPRREMYPSYERVADVLARRGVVPDLEADDDLRYSHRKTKDADFYFVANRRSTERAIHARFRVQGRQPEWWDAKTGERRDLPVFRATKGSTFVPLRLAPLESGFIVFRHPVVKAPARGTNFPRAVTVGKVEGPWRVGFDPKFSGPERMEFDRLADWRERPEIRHYSGKATYETRFDAPEGVDQLALGRVANAASVRLNGRDLGLVWSAPWTVRIPSGVLRSKGNVLQVTVANLWVNRLIGDAGLPAERRVSKTTWSPFRPDSPLQPSGLLGPVTLQRRGR